MLRTEHPLKRATHAFCEPDKDVSAIPSCIAQNVTRSSVTFLVRSQAFVPALAGNWRFAPPAQGFSPVTMLVQTLGINSARFIYPEMLRAEAKHLGCPKGDMQWEVRLRGLDAFESAKADFPYQNGNSLPGKGQGRRKEQ